MNIFSFLILLCLLTFFFFRDTLSYSFVSDDFFYASFNTIGDAVRFHQDIYHYNPVFWLVMLGLKERLGLNAYPFHLFTLSLHVVNIFLFFLTAALLFNKKTALLVSFMFAFFFSHYEVVYWVTGISVSLMVTFYMLGFISFIHFTKTLKPASYFIFVVSFLLSLLTHEYAISLLAVCFFYWFLFSRTKSTILASVKIFILPVIVGGVFTFVKVKFSEVSLVVHTPTVFSFVASVIKSYLYLFFPNPQLIDRLPTFSLKPLLGLALMLFVLKSIRRRIDLFLFLWLSTTIIVFSLTSRPQARYFYLSSIPAILLSVSLLQQVRLHSTSKGIQVYSFNLLACIYALFVVFSGILFLQEQKKYWVASSKVTQNTIQAIKHAYPHPEITKHLYFINLPDSINGPPWNAYVFRNGLEEALELSYGFKPGNTYFYRTVPVNQKTRDDPFIEANKLKALSEKGEVVFIYDENIGSVYKL